MTTAAAAARYRRYQNSDKGKAMLERRKPKKAAYDRARYAERRSGVIQRVAEWAVANPQQAFAGKRRHWLKQYGMTEESFRDMLVGQAARCAVCGNVMEPGKGTHIDHDHATGRVRGLLCGMCNRMLGMARDDRRVLRAAVRYLESFS